MLNKKIVLGTANFGQLYGILKKRKIKSKVINSIIKTTIKKKINTLDTSSSYGQSQTIIGKFGNSCGLLASNEAVPIIPICHNSGKYWINKSFKKKRGDINVVIGKPISGSDPKRLTEEARSWIANAYLDIS